MDYQNRTKEELIALLQAQSEEASCAKVFEELSQEGVVLCSDHLIIEANNAAHRLLGYGLGHLIGHSIKEYIDSETLVDFEQGDHSMGLNSQIARNDGSFLTAHIRMQCVGYQGRQVLACSFIDYSHFDLVDKRFKDIYELSPNAVLQLNPRGKLLAANPTGAALLGFNSQEEAVAAEVMTGDYLVNPEEGLAYFKRLRKLGVIPSQLFKARSPRSGKEKWIDVSSTGIYSGQGDLSHYETIVRDVTESKLMELHLQNERSRLNAVVNSIPGPVLAIRPDDSVVVDCNTKAKEIFGDIEGKEYNPQCFSREPQSSSRRSVETIEEGGITVRSWRCRDRKGTDWNVYNVPFHDQNGSPLILKFLLDISNRVVYEEKLKEARALSEQANKAKSDFLANMSHEIRTPLNGVLGTLQILHGEELTEEQQSHVVVAMECGRSLLNIINSILNISRVDAGMMEAYRGEVNPALLFAATTTLCAPQAHEKGLTLEFQKDPSLPLLVEADSERIRQILFNLIGNAIKFTDIGGIVVTASLLPFTRQDGSKTLYFSVTDTGVGIPPLLIDQAFDVFTQVDDSYAKRHQGAGLGLGIVKRLVELLGGTIVVESQLGEGTTMHVTVLVSELEDPVKPEVISTVSCEKFENIRVLIAEDELINRAIAKTVLEKLGCTVVTAADGLQVLEILAQQSFDLIFMDIQMPGCSGIDATRTIRNHKSFVRVADTPIIAMTAHAMDGDKQAFLKAGMDEYIAKPFDIEVIKKVMSKLLCEK